MKTRLKSILASLVLIAMITSAKPTVSQKVEVAKQDSAGQKAAPSDTTTVAPSMDSLFEVANKKADKAIQTVEQTDAIGARIETKLSRLESRQSKILNRMTPVKIPAAVPAPRPVTEYRTNADSLQIRPLEIKKTNWWRRHFH